MQNNNAKSKISFYFLAVIFSFSFFTFSLASGASAATLYLLPSTGNYTVGSNFSVVVKVSSGGVPINAAEGGLIFNPDEISVVSLSKSGSIFTLWTTEPTFSNAAGTIGFGGGTPTNFTGAAGTIITITFRPKRSGTTNVNFISGAVLAADGRGTNILANMSNGIYTLRPGIITPPAEEKYVPPVIPAKVPAAPIISSLTHPEEEKWYSNNDPEFSWQLPSDVTAVRLLIAKIPRAIPTVLYVPPISERKLEDLADGAWYLHAQFRNQYGWGEITHRKVLIDTQPPESFEIEVRREDPTDPQPILIFDTTDQFSGIEYYEVKISEEEPVSITPAYLKEKPYQMSFRAPGKHTILVKAMDTAGNFTIAVTDVTIEPISAPIITDFPHTVGVGDILTIKGTSLYPEGTVTVFVKKEGEEAVANNVRTDAGGSWLYVHPEGLEKGVYQVWAQITDKRDAKSNPTEKITIAAALPVLLKFGRIAVDYLTMIITLIILIIGAGIVIFYSWYRISIWRRRLRKETKELALTITKAFRTLREEVREQIKYLDKKPGLTEEEKEIRDKLQESLNISEEFISKELKDVEKELE